MSIIIILMSIWRHLIGSKDELVIPLHNAYSPDLSSLMFEMSILYYLDIRKRGYSIKNGLSPYSFN